MRVETVAILVDGGFYQRRAKALFGSKTARERADELVKYCNAHLRRKMEDSQTGSHTVHYDHLYRIFYYDCPPAENNVYHPYLRRSVSLKDTDLYTFMTAFHQELRSKRKFALRLGKLSSNNVEYTMTTAAQRKLLRGDIEIADLTESDFRLNIGQKGVDMRIGLDIASMAYKNRLRE